MDTRERIKKMFEKTEPIMQAGRKNKSERLKPCPYCGSESVTIIDHEDGLGACDYYVACNRCSAMGSFSDNLNDAVRKWNNRVINHGAWERRYMPSPHLECSECGYIVDCSDGSNYCPACGARMDKKE